MRIAPINRFSMKTSGTIARRSVLDAANSSAAPRGMASRLAFGACLMLMALPATAQVPQDYYSHKSNPAVAETLRTVEKYHLQQTINELRTKRYSDAWADVDFILRYFPNHPQGLMLMAKLCEVWRDPKCNTEGYFDKAVSVNPNVPGIYLTRGIFLHRNKRLPDAIANYKKALEISPDSVNAHFNLAIAFLAQKQYAAANEHAQQAYALGLTLPGLRSQLQAAGAWKAIEVKPTEAAPQPAEATELNSVEVQPAKDGGEH